MLAAMAICAEHVALSDLGFQPLPAPTPPYASRNRIVLLCWIAMMEVEYNGVGFATLAAAICFLVLGDPIKLLALIARDPCRNRLAVVDIPLLLIVVLVFAALRCVFVGHCASIQVRIPGRGLGYKLHTLGMYNASS